MIRKLFLIFLLIPLMSSASDSIMSRSDSIVNGHKTLRAVEVIGLKQMPVPEISAVTNINAPMLRRYNVEALKDISTIAPNFYLPNYGSRMTSSIYVRGLGARMDQPIVGLSVDNVPILNKNAYDFDVADMTGIEVLRGAQSLLNGRNTMGGQINIHTLSPWNYQGVKARLTYGRNNDLRASLSWYEKLSRVWATSVSAMFDMDDGYYVNTYNNKKIDHQRNGSLRWKLGWRPRAWVSVTNTASFSITRQGGYPYESLSTGRISYNDTCFYRRSSFSDGLTLAWAGKRVVVTSITSVQYLDDNMTLDQDFMPDDYFTLTQKSRELAFTEDLFTKGTRGRYDWLGGVFAFTKSNDMNAPVRFHDTGISELIERHRNDINPDYPIKWDSRSFVLGSDFNVSSRGIALYHESTYRLDKWMLQGGLRLDVERVGLEYHNFCNTGYETLKRNDDGTLTPFNHTALNINDRDNLSETYTELLPKLSASYDMDDLKIYASVSKAYKAGGYNTQMFSDVLQQRLMQFMGMPMNYRIDEIVKYKPEKSWNYEIGVKCDMWNQLLKADVTLFFIDCRDQQLTMFPPGVTTGRIMTNAGRTHSKGVEVSLTSVPVENLTLRANYGYTHAAFRHFADSKGDYRGKRLPYYPAHTLFVGADYVFPVRIVGATPSVNINLRGVGDIWWNEANTIRQPFYALLGASVALSSDRWSMRLWGENLTSTRYNMFYFVSIGHGFVQRARPWQAGVTLRYNFETKN